MPYELLAEPDKSFDRLAGVLRTALRAPTAAITFAESDRLLIPGGAGLGDPLGACRQVPLRTSICQYVVKDSTPLVIEDVSTDPRLADSPSVALEGIAAYLGVPLSNAEGRTVGAVCVIDHEPRGWTSEEVRMVAEVAEVASTEFRLRAATAALGRSYEQLTMFAGQISHDLKSPLGAVLGFLELATDMLPAGNDDVHRYLDRSTSSAQRMSRTIDELLAYATVGGTLARERLSLDAIMRSVLDDLAASADDADITWTQASFVADAVQLRCLVQNLVGNALKFRRRDVAPVITVSVEDFQSYAELRVADNGVGIPVEHRDEVLRPLVRLHHNITGTGLGLATCDRIATAHGGVLQLSGTPGGGTTVIVTLPYE